ncbi:hypothetical protein B0H13DRAFT_1894399 [Mycena leptocephala]|nr:hypothetical protein B0H13DRAFT_1894399 [Mycena leptocephala]
MDSEEPLTMRLMDRDAWKVKDAPSVVEGVDLLKIDEKQQELPLAHLTEGSPHISCWARLVFRHHKRALRPLMPPTDPKKIMVRRDMRYGPDDPVLWPQLYTDTFCHLAAIPKAPTSAQGQQKLGVMWWNPAHDDFVCPASGLTLTRGLGRLSLKRFIILSDLVQALINEYEQYYKPRMDGIKDLNAHTAYPDDCVGCFTQDPRIAQAFWQACLPCCGRLPGDESSCRVSPVAATDQLDDRLRLLHRCTQNTPWYRNPFADASPNVASTSVANISGPFRGGRAEGPSRKVLGSDHRMLKHERRPRRRRRHRAEPQRQGARDKFLPFQRLEMLTPITPWADALKAIDRDRPPSCGIDYRNATFCQSPPSSLLLRKNLAVACFITTTDCCVTHSCFACGSQCAARAAVHPTVARCAAGQSCQTGKDGYSCASTQRGFGELLRPAFQACGIDVLTDFPVPSEAVPTMRLHTIKELLWELAEINFRYEFLALDARASGLDRPDECRRCFAGEGLIGLDFRESQRGLAALGAMDRLPYLLCAAGLMCTWRSNRKKAYGFGVDANAVRQLERRVAQYYTQSFYELFGQAAVVPMRLDHEIGS